MSEKIKLVRDNKIYKVISTALFIAVLFYLGLCKVSKGVDISDTGYNYGNFKYSYLLDNMWYCSTFLANVVGNIFYRLPLGNTLMGLNIYTGLVKVITAIIAYIFLTRKIKMPGEIAFAGEAIALSLCWCPTALLYNYLSYLLFLLGTIFLYKGLVNNKNYQLIVAGVLLGANIFVRFPNLCECGLIIALWYYCVIKKISIKECIFKTLYCLVGYVVAVICIFVILGCLKGFDAYFIAIKELFSMTDEATQYSNTGIIMGLYIAYRNQIVKVIIAIALSIVAFMAEIFVPEKFKVVKHVMAIVLGLGFVGYLLISKVFDMDYKGYTSIYSFGVIVVTIMLIVLVMSAFIPRLNDNERLLSVLAVGIIGITPLGTNNEIYSNLNNLFIVMPVFLYIVARFGAEYKNLTLVRTMLVSICAVFAFQSLMFGQTFVFRDGLTAPMDTEITEYHALSGMRTTKENAKLFTNINTILKDQDVENRQVLLYGDVPALAFYLDMKPAISSTWPSLASYSSDKFDSELTRLDQAIEEKTIDKPVIFMPQDIQISLDNGGISKKEERLIAFMKKHRYKCIYISEAVCIYI